MADVDTEEPMLDQDAGTTEKVDEIAESKKLVKVPATRAMLTVVAENAAMVDLVSGIIEELSNSMAPVEAAITSVRAKAVLSQLAEPRKLVKDSAATIENRCSTALLHLREIQTRVMDLAKVCADLDAEGASLITRAVERGYTQPE